MSDGDPLPVLSIAVFYYLLYIQFLKIAPKLHIFPIIYSKQRFMKLNPVHLAELFSDQNHRSLLFSHPIFNNFPYGWRLFLQVTLLILYNVLSSMF